MKALVEGFPEQIQHAIELGEKISVKAEKASIQNVVVAGLGGSGIGANIVQAIVADKIKVPFSVYKTYDLPAFINEHTLFVACSFSGNTEETLASLRTAEQKGAQIVCITSGGSLLEIAEGKGYSYAPIPGESKSPRANLGYSFIQLLYMLHKKGLIEKIDTHKRLHALNCSTFALAFKTIMKKI
ncbi:MAG: SIS domain-containing protein, partial [Chitinophagaceae bacterium]